jgi:hypothetical protein
MCRNSVPIATKWRSSMGDLFIGQLGERATVREAQQTRLKDSAAIRNYAEKVHDALRASPDGLTVEAISRGVLGGGIARSRLGAALAILRQDGRASFSMEPRKSGGWTQRWRWSGEL